MSSTARKLDDHGHEPESIILVREAARKREAHHRHAAAPRPRLLPKKATAATPKRRLHLGLFAVVCLGIATVGLIAMLIVNTMLASGAFEVSRLQSEKALLTEQEQQLAEAVAVASSPLLLEEKVRAMGMVPQTAPAFIDLETGAIVGNDIPQPEPIVVDPATGTYVNGYLIDPATGEIYIDPYTGLPITQDGQPIGYDGIAVDGVSGEDPIIDPDTGEYVDPVTGQPIVTPDPGVGEALPGEDDMTPTPVDGTPGDGTDPAPVDPAPVDGTDPAPFDGQSATTITPEGVAQTP